MPRGNGGSNPSPLSAGGVPARGRAGSQSSTGGVPARGRAGSQSSTGGELTRGRIGSQTSAGGDKTKGREGVGGAGGGRGRGGGGGGDRRPAIRQSAQPTTNKDKQPCSRQISSRSTSITTADPEKLLDRDLKMRLQDLQVSKSRTNEHSPVVKHISQVILRYLKSEDAHSRWDVLNSGSYYEKAKIYRPDEYDLMFVCNIRSVVKYPENAKSFCALRSLARHARGRNHPVSHSQILTVPQEDGSLYLSPKLFKERFTTLVNSALQESQAELKNLKITHREDPNSPAVTLEVRARTGSAIHFTIDIVPAIKLHEWPATAKTWKCSRLPEIEASAKNAEAAYCPCVVAKIHKTELRKADKNCCLWRISFSATEKKIMLKASEQNGSNGCNCRKAVLRLLKSDLQIFRINNQHPIALCSFYIKTVFLWMLDANPKEDSWRQDKLRKRYVETLRRLISCLGQGAIPHYFIQSANLLENVPCDQLRVAKDYFHGIFCKYSAA